MTVDQNRQPLSFGEELDDLDPAAWAKPAAERIRPEETKRAAEATGFRSREPAAPAPKPKQQRRRRTGRSAQFNLKTTPETIEAFTRIADAQGWGLGEAFEKATALLERETAKG